MAKRKTKRSIFWRKAIGRWRKSSLPVKAFCQQEGFSDASFYTWRKKLSPGGARRRSGQGAKHRPGAGKKPRPRKPATGSKETPLFLPVRTVESCTTGGSVEIELRSGRVLRTGPDFDAQTVAHLAALLERPPC